MLASDGCKKKVEVIWMLSDAGKKINRCQLAGSKTSLSVSGEGEYSLPLEKPSSGHYHLPVGVNQAWREKQEKFFKELIIQSNGFYAMQEAHT